MVAHSWHASWPSTAAWSGCRRVCSARSSLALPARRGSEKAASYAPAVSSPHIGPISDELRMAIGDLAIVSTKLEAFVAQFVALARNEDDEWVRTTLASTGGAVRQLRALAGDVDDPGLRAQIDRLVMDMRAALDARNKLIHSVAVVNVGDDGQLRSTFWHPRSDAEGPVDPGQITAQVGTTNAIGARVILLSKDANEWRRLQDGPGPG